MTSIKHLIESSNLKYVPPNYCISSTEPISTDLEASIPTVDFSLLTSSDPEKRSKAVQDLGRACQEWGFFLLVNHGVADALMKGVMDGCNEFFNMREEEKEEYKARDVLDPIRYGTSFNTSKEKTFYWRDFIKVFVHPEFHFPNKPLGFREPAQEYCERSRELVMELLRGISLSLGLEESYMYQMLDIESSFQIFVANFYPACPQPELALGMPPHSDHGLLTLLIQNGVGGFQLHHNGNWVNVNAPPYSFLVNTGDHLEILSNGKYRSVMHRAIVNNKTARISIAMVNGPSLETIVKPATEIADGVNNLPAYSPMKYKEYLQLQQGNQLDGKSCLDRVRLH